VTAQASGTPSPARTTARLLAALAAFVAVLFVARFVARGHLVTQADEMCHAGGIAVDLLAHGIRFPLLVYAQNEHDNGSFVSGVLTAAAFSVFGRSVLALQLVTLCFTAAGGVAALALLRACLRELDLTHRRVRWVATAVLVLSIALAPRVVTMVSSATTGMGGPAEGVAFNTILLALFSRRVHSPSVARAAAFWILVGLALYVNKATALVIPVLGAAEMALAWKSPRRLAGAAAGFALGALPELWVVARSQGMGWAGIVSKTAQSAHGFPHVFFDSVLTFADHRVGLLVVWALALAHGAVLLVRSAIRFARADAAVTRSSGATPPVPAMLAVVFGVACLHLVVLTLMAQGGIDHYALYGYPTLVVLAALLVAAICADAEARWGARPGALIGTAAIGATLVLYRPDAMTLTVAPVSSSWRNRVGAACSWRLAEGFGREHDAGLAPPGRTRDQHVIERCRSLAEPGQVLDCIGGIARERQLRGVETGSRKPPLVLSPLERRAFAYYAGVRRRGDIAGCSDLGTAALAEECADAARLGCLSYADLVARFAAGRFLGRPRCAIGEPPMDGYWAALRLDLLGRDAEHDWTSARILDVVRAVGNEDLPACAPVLAACY